jgi:hypothetical protein
MAHPVRTGHLYCRDSKIGLQPSKLTFLKAKSRLSVKFYVSHNPAP